MHSAYRRKKEAKRGVKFTMMVVGSSGTGKTTFINNLLDHPVLAHKYRPQPGTLPSGIVKVTKPTTVVSFNSSNGVPSFQEERVFNPLAGEVGVSVSSTEVEIGDESEEKLILTVVDTHGMGENLDNSIAFDEFSGYLKAQFDYVLAEETRVQRNPRFEDSRVHVVLYFIDYTHGLRELDVEIMKKMAKYANVLPVLSKADVFTRSELEEAKRTVKEDLERYNVPTFHFDYDEEEDDIETVEENQMLADLLPFAVMTSEIKADGKYVREYPWGTVDVAANSDVSTLKNVLFGSHLQDLKDYTQNFLYENYRAERLSSVSQEKSTDTAAPSMSNLAALVNNQFGSTMSLDAPSTPKMSSEFEHGSPIKDMSDSIRRENEQIIRDIKSSPQVPFSPDPNRNKLRNMSETVPYVLKHERIIARQQKLEELEAQSARELQRRIAELERKAAELKQREKQIRGEHMSRSNSAELVRTETNIKREETSTDQASIAGGKD